MAGRATPTHVRRRVVAVLAIGTALALCVAGLATLLGGGADDPARARIVPRSSGRRDVAARRPLARRGPSTAGIAVGRWTIRRDSPLSRSEVSAALVGRVAYVVGGFTSDLRSSAAVERLDLRSGRWSRGTPLPQPLNHMSAVGYQGALYVVGGYSGPQDVSAGAVRSFWRFDPTSRRWARLPDAPLARAAAGAAVLGHRLYVAGGRSDTRPTISTLAIYDFDSHRWTIGPPLRHAREHVAAVAADGAIWLLGGRALGQGNFADVERFTPGASAWRRMKPMPIARSSFQAVAVGAEIVAVGGENASTTFSEVDALATRSGRWHRLADLPAPHHGLGLVADGPLIYAIEGGPQAGLTTSRTVQRLRVR